MFWRGHWRRQRRADGGGCHLLGQGLPVMAPSWKWETHDQKTGVMTRLIIPEWLDDLPAADPGAIRSRRDLQRLNFLMGHVRVLARLLKKTGMMRSIRTLVELGAGDGAFLLQLARRIAP